MKARSLSRAAWLRTACGSAAAAIAAAAVLVGTPKSSKEPDEAKRLALYWSGYASAYAGLHGSADGMEEALRRDAAAHPAGGAVYLEVRTAAGETIAVAGEDGPRGSRLSSVKPFMLDGRVAGTVEASVASSAGGHAAVWPAAAGMAAFVCAWGLMRLEAARGQASAETVGDEIMGRIMPMYEFCRPRFVIQRDIPSAWGMPLQVHRLPMLSTIAHNQVHRISARVAAVQGE
ncbi:hypothetical protein, partial [Paenibacillus sp. P22]|uniref:hypothetical protein n=1 Tax=Paenibacillus sp. P22 TaxID=483908 RepID=UPI00043465A2